MNIFQWLFQHIVYDPQLNVLLLFFNITGDIGVSIILLALVVNLIMWPIFASSYLNSQKLRILQPKLKEIQEKYKEDQQELLKQTMDFNRKHGINGGSVFLVVFLQLFFASGLYFVINDVTAGKNLLDHYYTFTANLPRTEFSSTAFGFIPVKASANEYIWLPIINSVFSFLYGMYVFRWAPKIPLPEPKKESKVENKDEKAPAFDPVALQKSMEYNTIYVMPAFLFLINLGFPAGLNIYFTTVSLLSFLRQVFITRYYAGHVEKLLEDIAETDPQSKDNNPDNNIDMMADPADMVAQPAVEVVQKKKARTGGKLAKKNAKPKSKSKA